MPPTLPLPRVLESYGNGHMHQAGAKRTQVTLGNAKNQQKNKTPRYLEDSGGLLFGVADGARTHDNRNHNPGLYQLSYSHRRKARL